MDFNYSAEDRAFCDEVGTRICNNLPDDLRDKVVNYHHLGGDDYLGWHKNGGVAVDSRAALHL